jgi:hypothetical protein
MKDQTLTFLMDLIETEMSSSKMMKLSSQSVLTGMKTPNGGKSKKNLR